MRELTATAAAENLTTLCDYVADSHQTVKIIRPNKRACLLMCADAYQQAQQEAKRREQEYQRRIAELDAQIPRFTD